MKSGSTNSTLQHYSALPSSSKLSLQTTELTNSRVVYAYAQLNLIRIFYTVCLAIVALPCLQQPVSPCNAKLGLFGSG